MEGNSFAQLLKSYDLKATPQRIIFLKELESMGHLSIEELEKRIKDVIPTISTATIYKNINAMVEKGLLSEVKLPNSKTKYEIKKESHSHFLCESCKKVYDIDIDTKCIEKEIEKGFLSKNIDVVITGICPDCRG